MARARDLPVAARLARAGEKGPSTSFRSIDFASTYKSTPPLIDLRAPCSWTFLTSAEFLTAEALDVRKNPQRLTVVVYI